MRTFQDYEIASEKKTFILDAISEYRSSKFYKDALDAEAYFKAENTGILNRPKWTMKKNGKQISFSKNIAISNFLFRFIVQQNQHLLSNGVEIQQKEKLGMTFDKMLESIGERALVHGVCYGFWNMDHIEKFEALNFFTLLDERTSQPKLGVRFWQTSQDKPMYVQVYEVNGFTEYKTTGNGLQEIQPLTPYKLKIRKDMISTEIISSENYAVLPIIPLYANDFHRSEFTASIKSKIDLYDKIFSDFGDNLERTNDIYWVIKNYGGDNAKELLAEIEEYRAVIADDESSAEPHTIEVPFQARQVALDMLKKELYSDYMALNMDEISGGSLTNVAISTATANLNMKVNRYEWQVYQFVQSVLMLSGIETQDIKFRRQSIANELEQMQMLYMCRADLDLQTALEKNPLVNIDEVDEIMRRLDLESVNAIGEVM